MHDPMALVTDYLLAAFAFFFARRLYLARSLWSAAFVFTGVAAFLGGTYHGLFEHPLLWKGVVYSVGIAGFCLLFAAGGRALFAFGAVKLAVYMIWMSFNDDFVWVIADYGITLILVAIVSPARKWVVGSIAVSVVGALVQQARLTIHEYWFDFNDLYHLIQIVALWLLYRAGLAATTSATEPLTIQPT